MSKRIQLFVFFIVIFLLTTPQVFAQKLIYSPEEYRNLVKTIFETKLKKYTKIYSTTFEVNYDLPTRRETVTIDMFSPPYEVSEKMKEEINVFKKRNKIFYSSKFYYIYLLKEQFFFTPVPIQYFGMFTCPAETIFNLRFGNCFSLTNLFVALSREAGMESYYYLVPDVSATYLSGETLVSTIHIICGVEVGASSPYFVDFLPGTEANNYSLLLKFHKLKKLSDIEAAGLFYNNLACKFYLEKDYGFSEYLFQFASSLYPDSPLIANNLGVVYKKVGDYNKSMEYFLKALELGGNIQSIIANIISTKKYLSPKEKEYIEEVLEDSLKTNYYWHLLKADKYLAQKDFDKALEEIKIADSLSPENQQVYSYYIRYAAKTGDKKMLDKYLQKIRYFLSRQ